MALGIVGSGTQTCVLDTPAALDTETVAGIYVALWNLELNVKGDITRCYISCKVLTGDTAAIVFEGVYANDLGASPIIQSPPIVSMFSLTMSIEQTDGTGRNVPWSLIRVAEF